MILLDKKFNEIHQEMMNAKTLKSIGFQKVTPIKLKQGNSVTMEQNVLDLRPVVGTLASGP